MVIGIQVFMLKVGALDILRGNYVVTLQQEHQMTMIYILEAVIILHGVIGKLL